MELDIKLSIDEIHLIIDLMASATADPNHAIGLGEANYDALMQRFRLISDLHYQLMDLAHSCSTDKTLPF